MMTSGAGVEAAGLHRQSVRSMWVVLQASQGHATLANAADAAPQREPLILPGQLPLQGELREVVEDVDELSAGRHLGWTCIFSLLTKRPRDMVKAERALRVAFLHPDLGIGACVRSAAVEPASSAGVAAPISCCCEPPTLAAPSPFNNRIPMHRVCRALRQPT